MKVQIFRVPLNHLWIKEYCIYLSQVVAVFLKFNPEALHLKKAFDRVLAIMPEIAKIKAQELGSELSHQLADLNNERRTLITTIADMVRNFGKLSLPAIAEHVAVMNRFLDKHGRNIGETNYNDNTSRFIDLLADFDANTDVKTAAASLQTVLLFDHLREINTRFANLFLERSDENSDVETVDARAIRAEMDKALTTFYDTFEIFSVEYDELDYQTPANKMNEINTYYKSELKARTTRRNGGKDVHTEDPIAPKA